MYLARRRPQHLNKSSIVALGHFCIFGGRKICWKADAINRHKKSLLQPDNPPLATRPTTSTYTPHDQFNPTHINTPSTTRPYKMMQRVAASAPRAASRLVSSAVRPQITQQARIAPVAAVASGKRQYHEKDKSLRNGVFAVSTALPPYTSLQLG